MPRSIVTAREQYEMLAPWRIIVADQIGGDPTALADRLRDLNRRHTVNRISKDPANMAKYAPLSEDEDNERLSLRDWHTGLNQRWDNMDPMSPDELAAHRALSGAHAQRDPDQMSARDKGDYYSELSDYDPSELTPRERMHFNGMQDWAQTHFGNMQNDAVDELGRFNDYQTSGRHADGATTMEGYDNAHHPDLTGAWAAEHLNSGGHLGVRANEYHQALKNVAENGPLGKDDRGRAHHTNLEDARNNMRVELQHKGVFAVPHIDDLSRVEDPEEAHARGFVVNPRWQIGTGGKNEAARNAYKVNCQRAVLAADARHRGYNVEAQRNYQPRGKSVSDRAFADRSFNDHDIAGFWKDENGQTPRWTDPQDAGHPQSKKQWDAMHKDIASWGPGARGVVSFSYATPGGYARHIINANVDKTGTPNYYDAQSGNSDVSGWRDRVGYRMHANLRAGRERANAYSDPVLATEQHNRYASPLRYLRTDDKQLNPQMSQHMIDRGTAGDQLLEPPNL